MLFKTNDLFISRFLLLYSHCNGNIGLNLLASMCHFYMLFPRDFLFTTCENETLQLPVRGRFALYAECLECSNT